MTVCAHPAGITTAQGGAGGSSLFMRAIGEKKDSHESSDQRPSALERSSSSVFVFVCVYLST